MSNIQRTNKNGFTLVEMLVVIMIFAILGVVSTQALVLSLRGTSKSQSLIEVKENVDYSLSTMERLLRNAQDLDCALSTGNRLWYTDENGNDAFLTCRASGSDNYIASNSGVFILTTPDVRITNCGSVFTCTEGASGVPDTAEIRIEAEHTGKSGAEGSQVTSSTRIQLRSY